MPPHSRILLVQHQPGLNRHFPLGLGYVAGALQSNGHRVEFIDLALNRNPLRALRSCIRTFRPHVLGFTLWTWTHDVFVDLMSGLPERKGLVVVAGGPHASVEAESVLRSGCVDVVVRQEGETLAPGLFNALAERGDLNDVPGIAFLKEDGSFVQTPEGSVVTDLDHLPDIPYTLFPLHRYNDVIHGRRAINLQTSRGCPYNCVFCHRGPAAGRRFRCRSPRNVISDLELLHDRYGFDSFAFFDDIFTLDRERTLELCRRMAALPWRPSWVCQTRVDRVDSEMLPLMARAGCAGISFGVESGNQEIIDKLGKGITLDQARQAFRHCREARIPSFAFFVLGTPWETAGSFRQTCAFARELRPTNAIFFTATPFPGTRLREIYLEMGLPLPNGYSKYDHYQSGVGLKPSPRENRGIELPAGDLCGRARRNFLSFQIAAVRDHPRLFRENLCRFGFRGFASRTLSHVRKTLNF